MFAFSPIELGASLRQGLLLGSALGALLAATAPVAAQTYVGNDFAPGSSLLMTLETIGFKDGVPPFVILQEYSPSGPTTSGAIFGSAGTVNDVTFYGSGNYDFTVYALALVGSNTSQNELTFNVVGDETFTGDATTKGVQNLSANFAVGAGDYLAFAGTGPYYPQEPNDAVGSDATYESSSEPNTLTAIPPTAGETFTVGTHGDANTTYDIGTNLHGNQGRYYGIGVDYTPGVTVPPSSQVYLNSASLGQTNLSWSNQDAQSNWVTTAGGATASAPPQAGQDVFLTNATAATASGSTVMAFDAATDPKIKSLTIDSNSGGHLVELSQSANTLTTGSETIGTTGPAEHLQKGGVNSVTGALTVNGFGTYDLQGGTLNAPAVTVNSGGNFVFDGGTAAYTNFNLNTGGAVTSNGSELVEGAFTQQGGTNTTNSLSLGGVSTTTSNGYDITTLYRGSYDLQNGTLSAATINVTQAGTFYFDFNRAISVNAYSGVETIINGVSFTTFNLDGGTVAASSPGAFLTSSHTNYYGSGTEVLSAPGSLTLPSAPGSLPTASGGATFNQNGGDNYAGALVLGQDVMGREDAGVYDLSGGNLYASSEAIGGGVGLFSQTGGENNVNGTVTVGANSFYVLQAGGLSATDLKVNAGGSFSQTGGQLSSSSEETIAGAFTQVGGTNTTGALTLASASTNPVGTYDLQGGTLNATTVTVNTGGNFVFDGGTAAYTNFYLNTGGTVTSSGSEVVNNGGTFTLQGGTNTTNSLSLGTVSTTTSNGYDITTLSRGSYDLHNGTLSADTITVTEAGTFYFDFDPNPVSYNINAGRLSFTTFNLDGGTVAASSPGAFLTSSHTNYYGSGTEVLSAPGSLTLPSAPGSLPTASSGATFNQSGGDNYAGALISGPERGSGRLQSLSRRSRRFKRRDRRRRRRFQRRRRTFQPDQRPEQRQWSGYGRPQQFLRSARRDAERRHDFSQRQRHVQPDRGRRHSQRQSV